jgi:hypothetical protein
VSVWEQRDRPVLEHLNANPTHGMLWVETSSDNPRPDFPALSGDEYYLAVMTLHDAGYVVWTRSEAEGGGSRYSKTSW